MARDAILGDPARIDGAATLSAGPASPDGVDPPRAVRGNIEAIVHLEEEGEQGRMPLERVAEVVGAFAGTVWFVLCQLAFVAAWILVNRGVVPGLEPFDPYPFSLLSTVLSLEGVLLTAFVLIRQNRMNAKADRRNHLGLQINLLAEKETTKIIQMLEHVSRHLGVEGAIDQETKELGRTTAVEGLARELDGTLTVDGA